MRALISALVVLATTSLLSCARQPQSAPASALPAGVPLVEAVPDLPDFPSATLVSAGEKGPSEGWSKAWKRQTETTASYQDVRDFYLDQFAKRGWTIHSAKEKPGEVEWGLAKGTSWGEVEVEIKAGAIKIKLERKDR